MKFFVLFALLTAALAPHSIAGMVASKPGQATCKKDAPDHAPYLSSSYNAPAVKKQGNAGIAK